jgi:hypothetical protein
VRPKIFREELKTELLMSLLGVKGLKKMHAVDKIHQGGREWGSSITWHALLEARNQKFDQKLHITIQIPKSNCYIKKL